MSTTEQMEVLIAVYLFEDLGKKDYEAVMDLVEADEIHVQGVVLATKDDEGEMKVIEAGDHAVRKGATMLGGAGLVVGLFAPPLLAATAVGAGVGAMAGKFAKHRLESGIADKLDTELPNGSAALIAIYDSGDADKVKGAIPNSIRSSTAEVDGKHAKELKAGLEEASAGLSG